MDTRQTLLIAIPTVTALVGAILGAWVGSLRTRARLEAKLRELENRAVTAEAAAAALGKKVESMKSDIVDEVRDNVDTSLFRFFTDVKTKLGKSNDVAAIRQVVERAFHLMAQNLDELRSTITDDQKRSTRAPEKDPARRPSASTAQNVDLKSTRSEVKDSTHTELPANAFSPRAAAGSPPRPELDATVGGPAPRALPRTEVDVSKNLPDDDTRV